MIRRAVVTSIAVSIGMLGVGVGVAQAAPTGCSYGITPNAPAERSAYAYCSGGTGQFRPVASCYTGAGNFPVYGTWTNPNTVTTIVTCPANTTIQGSSIQLR